MPEETRPAGMTNKNGHDRPPFGYCDWLRWSLIIYLTAKDKPFAYEQSKEALNFQITVAIAW